MPLPDARAYYRYRFFLTDSSQLEVSPLDAKRVMDRRGDQEKPQVVWEVSVAGQPVKRLWPEEIVTIDFFKV